MRFRKHLRLKEYDYTNPNYYFLTICTRERRELFVPRVSERYGKLFHQNVAAASYAANNTDIFVRCLQDLENKYYDNLK